MTLPPEHHNRPATQTLRWMFRPIEYMEEARSRYGETFGVKFIGFTTPLYFTSDPAAAKAIYSTRANTLPPGRNTVLEPVMGPRSILLLEGAEHLARRKVMLPPFHGERMRAYEDVIQERDRPRDRLLAPARGVPNPSAHAERHPGGDLRAVFGVADAGSPDADEPAPGSAAASDRVARQAAAGAGEPALRALGAVAQLREDAQPRRRA